MARLLSTGLLVTAGVCGLLANQATHVPKIWDDASLSDWATPVAGLNVRPAHYSSTEYYAAPEDNLRTYPVYPKSTEPPGYWEWLNAQTAEPLVDVTGIRTQKDWADAGERAFRDMDVPLLRTNDPKLIEQVRRNTYEGVLTFPDGGVGAVRWVVTKQGLMVGVRACAACHNGRTSDDRLVFGGPGGGGAGRGPDARPLVVPGMPLAGAPGTRWRLQQFYTGDPIPTAFWREFSVPWSPDARIERVKTMTVQELQNRSGNDQLGRSFSGGVFARSNGSPYAPTKISDLQNLRYSRYLDATGTHRLRGPEDVGRYAALVTGADRMDFGPHQMLTNEQRRVRFRYADEVLYAIGVYLMSLEPPKSPNTAPRALLNQGEQIFRREGCASCHAPPAYTTGKLTVADGYSVPADHPNRADIMDVSVGTDVDGAMKTRKGTGLYKIPSLRGVWYRPRLLHDGSLASLDEMFDAARLDSTYEPKGWNPPGINSRAVPGHTFGLGLNSEEKAALLAFLRSL
jgi:mono/diheme cytochrome c family protein